MADILKKVIPLNRVEGDLEIHIELDRNNEVVDARSVGTMYRGIENLMTGRGPLDGLVITPRICGICTTSHLNAAAKALDMAFSAAVPDNARRLRNVTLMVEQMQNDLRHLFLLFLTDFTDARYARAPWYGQALQRYQTIRGTMALEVVQETRKVIEVVAILGGQWPHSSFMVPGGVVSVPSGNDIAQCRHIMRAFRRWYERRILGCSLERWRNVRSQGDLDAWLEEDDDHRSSELGFFIQLAGSVGLNRIGRAHDCFISSGGVDMPHDTRVQGDDESRQLFPPGIFTPLGPAPFDPEKITEDVAAAFFKAEGKSRHPYEGRTVTDADTRDPGKYSWAKAPRYDGRPMETGPLADMLSAGDPLFTEAVRTRGASVFLRELARMVRAAHLLPAVDQWLVEMTECDTPFYQEYWKQLSAQGHGFVPAPRGFLGHWVVIKEGRIANYQVITPTTWNGSPRDGDGVRGPWEEAIMGLQVDDPQNPIEVGQVVRSFDPCLVCTVHAVRTDKAAPQNATGLRQPVVSEAKRPW